MRFYKERLLGSLLLLGLFAVLCLNVQAQLTQGLNETTNTGLGGSSFIIGTVFSPSGRPIQRRLRLRLSSMSRETLTSTDDTGKFIFSGIVSGTYTLTIDEKEFEPFQQQIEVNPQARESQTYPVTVRLVASRESLAKPGVIDSETASIPKAALENYSEAIALAEKRDHVRAIELLKASVNEHPEFVMAFNELGVQYIKINDLINAEQSLRSALKLKRDAYAPLFNFGLVMMKLGHPDKAEVVMQEALKIRPGDALIYFYLGRSRLRQNKLADAEKDLTQALKIGDTQVPEAHRALAEIYVIKGQNDQAIKRLEMYLKAVPDTADAVELRQLVTELKQVKNKKNPQKPIQ